MTRLISSKDFVTLGARLDCHPADDRHSNWSREPSRRFGRQSNGRAIAAGWQIERAPGVTNPGRNQSGHRPPSLAQSLRMPRRSGRSTRLVAGKGRATASQLAHDRARMLEDELAGPRDAPFDDVDFEAAETTVRVRGDMGVE